MESENSDSTAPDLLAEVTARAETTRKILRRDGWQWLVIWALTCTGAGVSGFFDVAQWYWVVALPTALALTALVSRRIDSRKPVRRYSWRYWSIGAAIVVVNMGASFVLPAEVVVVLVWVVFGLGFTGFAVLEGQRTAARLFLALSATSAVLGLLAADTFLLYPYLAFLHGAGLAGVAVGLWIQDSRA